MSQTPQRTDSAKKPKIKLNTSSTPKAANGAGTPKAKEASAAKPKEDKKEAEKKAAKAKMSPEERRERKQVCEQHTVVMQLNTNNPHRRKFCSCDTSSKRVS